MSEIVDGATGQLRHSAAELAVHEMLAVPDGVYGTPVGHFEIDQMIIELADVLSHVARVVVLLYEDVHRAEEKHVGAVADFMTMHERSGSQMARQFAHAKTRTELHEVNLAKEKLRYAEEMQKSLQNRSFGLMNIGKRMTAQMGFGTK